MDRLENKIRDTGLYDPLLEKTVVGVNALDVFLSLARHRTQTAVLWVVRNCEVSHYDAYKAVMDLVERR